MLKSACLKMKKSCQSDIFLVSKAQIRLSIFTTLKKRIKAAFALLALRIMAPEFMLTEQILKVELEIKETGYLKFRQEYGVIEEQLDHLRSERKGILNDQLLFHNSKLRNENVHVSNFELQKEELMSGLSKWEDQYLLKSPIAGRVSFFDVWGKHQNVEDGQVIFTIVPMGQMEYLGMCRVPFRNSGRIKAGQRVIIKLESYPYREWGSVDGEVQMVSEVPKIGENEGYIAYITIKDLITSYGKSLEFKQEMVGSAEIILEEVTLLQRIFYQFRNLWSQTKI